MIISFFCSSCDRTVTDGSFFHQNSQSFRFLDPGIKATIVTACGLCSEWNSTMFFFFIYGIIVFINFFILLYIFSVYIFLQSFYTST